MRLVTFEDRADDAMGGPRLGVLEGGAVADIGGSLVALCGGGPAALAQLRAALPGAARLPLDRVRLLAPFPRPARNIFCVGKNYHEHAEEFHRSGFDTSSKDAIPDRPVVFTKAPSAVIGPDAAIPSHLDPTHSTDYEGELAVVIGRGGRGIAAADAFAHVFGYTIVNDVTARTLQHAHKQWFLGKSIDGFCPMGPCVLTADAVADIRALRVVTRVNGEPRQDAPVADLIFDIPTLIETISARITLEPGDLIATGTPAGVGIGFSPPKYLRNGDVVAITIDGIGTLSNPVA
jgi:2-keto-4-pentenoate hydratase/2-oxohepta-3-ene-1,7-dioic acid hydratase in catechol pathway